MMRRLQYWVAVSAFSLGGVAPAQAITDAEREFFESRIRPILAQECYECHSGATKSKGGLLLDTRAGWERGGDSGPVIVPGKPEESLLLKSIAHEIEDLKMPKAGAQLDHQLIDDFRHWIAMGAPDPRDAPPSPEQLSQDTNWEAIRERRKGWWSFQPIRDPEIPVIEGATHPVDRFVRSRLEKEGLEPAGPADPATLHRRLSFALVGLPPSLEESENFQKEWTADPDKATSSLVDHLIASPAFGERWARHWMDWVRYAETHGSEGDPAIPHAWQYRDYLIRALNDDVPYGQLVKEHLAGDLLAEPRINPSLQLNESAIGTAHYRMVFHGFAPTDALDERVKFTDDQINTVTKAFLGLTVSCARCHDHKFDAISQADYYAMYGIFTNGLPATVSIDAPGVLEQHRDELKQLKGRIRSATAAFWLESLRDGSFDFNAPSKSLQLLAKLTQSEDPASGWQQTRSDFEERLRNFHESRNGDQVRRIWELSDPEEAGQWTKVGEGMQGDGAIQPGEFVVGMSGIVERFLPGGVFSHSLSTKHRGFLASPPQPLDDEYDLYLNVIGENSSARFAVQHYPRRGTVYPVTNLEKGVWQWVKYDRIDYWKGDDIHLELSTAADAPVLVKNEERSWFGIREALLVKKGSPSPERPEDEWLGAVLSPAGERDPKTAEEIRSIYVEVIRNLLGKWQNGEVLSDAGALLLEDLRAGGALPNKGESVPAELASLLTEYRDLESQVPTPTRAPGIAERPGVDQALYVRGNHKEPGEIVPRRFLEAIDETPYETSGSGRLELAADFLRDDNPFTARVAVNRIWTYLFGEGLVATVDNFGRLGEEPSHPELLDHLATRFRGEMDWSVKALIRELVLSETFRQSSNPSPEAAEQDPDNRLLSHYSVRRLDAEAIRDSLLAISGELDGERYGVPQGETSPRRALYLRVIRNNLHPLLATFDFPVPASTVGTRDSTNVPAQSLTLLNDPFIAGRAAAAAKRAKAAMEEAPDDEAMIDWVFRAALNREPTLPEIDSARSFLHTLEQEYRVGAEKRAGLQKRLTDLEAEREGILEPVRERLFASLRKPDEKAVMPVDPGPVSHWNFEQGLNDLVGESSLTLEGSAKVEGGALVLDGSGYAISQVLKQDLSAKTLDVIVELETLDQRGGGVMTVQDARGTLFDSIVFAERRPLRWLAGSNRHVRTADFNGPDEKDAVKQPVRLTFTYDEDGTIRGFRDGKPLGEPVRVSDLQNYSAGDSEVVLGLRHGKGPGGNRSLKGRIYEATLFDRALSPEEVGIQAGQTGVYVSKEMILDSLTEPQREKLRSIDQSLDEVKDQLSGFRPFPEKPDRKWQDLVHAVFNLKEFIYLQ